MTVQPRGVSVVARLGKPHGIRGEFTAEVRTDDPGSRFVPGTVFGTEPDCGTLELTSARWHKDRLLLSFAEITTRNQAEEIRNTCLVLTENADDSGNDEDEAWPVRELIGLRVVVGEKDTGEIVDITTGTAQDLLHICVDSNPETPVLVPFVHQLVPVVDIQNGYVIVTPPGGLFPS